MNRSSKYQFYLPQNTDPISVNDFNYNFGIIDANLLTKEQTLTNTEKQAARDNIGLGAAATRGVANNLTTESSGSVLDARQGKAISDALDVRAVGKRQTISITGSSSAQSIQIDLANGGYFIFLSITGLNRIWAGLVYTGSDGSTNVQQMNTSTGITVTTGSYCIYANFTHTSNSSMNMVAIPLRSNNIPTFHE